MAIAGVLTSSWGSQQSTCVLSELLNGKLASLYHSVYTFLAFAKKMLVGRELVAFFFFFLASIPQERSRMTITVFSHCFLLTC